jgi:ribonuclease E
MIARLEALLARVRSRSAEPRRKRVPVMASEHPSVIDDDEAGEEPTRPPPANTEVDLVVEVDGREPRQVVVGAPVEEVASEKAFESRERLVAAEPVTPEEPAHEVAITPSPAVIDAAAASAPEVEAVIEEADEVVVEEAPVAEEAPASSRRPVAPEPEERIAQIAFGAEEPRAPLHTPPPESGRLPAAAVADFDADVTGVRDAAPLGPLRAKEQQQAAHADAEVAAAEAAVTATDAASKARSAAPAPGLVAEATRAHLLTSDAVAEIIGEAQRFAPSTFVALLDASLAL